MERVGCGGGTKTPPNDTLNTGANYVLFNWLSELNEQHSTASYYIFLCPIERTIIHTKGNICHNPLLSFSAYSIQRLKTRSNLRRTMQMQLSTHLHISISPWSRLILALESSDRIPFGRSNREDGGKVGLSFMHWNCGKVYPRSYRLFYSSAVSAVFKMFFSSLLIFLSISAVNAQLHAAAKTAVSNPPKPHITLTHNS